MKKIIVVSVLLLASLFSIIVVLQHKNEVNNYSIKTFEIENGWGYSIFKEEKIIIRQTIVPSIAYKKHFENEQDALNCGKIMLKKLRQHKIPSVTMKELRMNNINL